MNSLNHHTSRQFDIAGPKDAPALLLIHGSVVTRKMWIPQMRALCDHFRVIAPDLPGHGDLSRTPFTLEGAVSHLYDIIDQEAHHNALVVGVSLGGYVAAALAHQHPERVAGVIMASATMNPVGALGFWFNFTGTIMGGLSQEWLATGSARSLRRKLPADLAEPIIAAGMYPRGGAESFVALAGHDFRAILSEIQAPILLVNGELDRAARREEAAFLASNRLAHLEVIPGAGHICNLDQPQAFTQVVRDFATTIGWQASFPPHLHNAVLESLGSAVESPNPWEMIPA
jgi:pimeloyl-ACP methyl ester carboxylesterase